MGVLLEVSSEMGSLLKVCPKRWCPALDVLLQVGALLEVCPTRAGGLARGFVLLEVCPEKWVSCYRCVRRVLRGGCLENC